METNWAAENLQTIRTLMERSAVYRRALAPIMTFSGGVGLLAGGIGWSLRLNAMREFALFWMAAAVITLAGSFILIRRQALKDSEPFWSPPTRRVAQALSVPFFVGVVIGATAVIFGKGEDTSHEGALILGWVWLYGCAIHSAGFFMLRGIKLFAWLFIVTGCALLIGMMPLTVSPHLLMGTIFGGLHLAYGIYLYFTEKRGNEP
jgi:hypothetical protein